MKRDAEEEKAKRMALEAQYAARDAEADAARRAAEEAAMAAQVRPGRVPCVAARGCRTQRRRVGAGELAPSG